MLPMLAHGSRFMNGKYDGISEKEFTGSFRIPDMSHVEFVQLKTIPKSLYSFMGNQRLADEFLCKFVVGGINYFIPQMELIRTFFGREGSLVNKLLTPIGARELCMIKDFSGNNVTASVSEDYAVANLNHRTASMLAAIVLQPEMYDFWCSVRNPVLIGQAIRF
jgi:hypothetical protein